ncbi:MAG: FkbM family methyltransferase [Pseudomonadota bacterium]
MDGAFVPDAPAFTTATGQDTNSNDLARQRRRAARRERHAWARGVLDGILSQLRPGDVALDCGANVGEISVPIAQTGATLYSFEPDPVAFARLAERLAPFPNAHPIAAAVSDKVGTATLRRTARVPDDPLGATVSSTLMDGNGDADVAGGNDLDVPVIDLTDVLRDMIAGRVPRAMPPRPGIRRRPGRVALLKMDIQGEELNLLPALHDADLLTHIGCTLVETHQRKFRDLRRDFLQMRRDIGGLYSARKVNLDWV